LPNAVKTSAMNLTFDVAHDTDLLKSQLYLYMHITCIETILHFCFKEILCHCDSCYAELLEFPFISKFRVGFETQLMSLTKLFPW
jgi:hypothetical protein